MNANNPTSLVNALRWYLAERQNDAYTGGWVHKGQLERLAMDLGYLGDNCGRRLREMERDGIVQSRKDAGKKSLEYRYAVEMPVAA